MNSEQSEDVAPVTFQVEDVVRKYRAAKQAWIARAQEALRAPGEPVTRLEVAQ